MELAGKIALITGGGTGIGLAVAEIMGRHGARVAIASRNPSHLRSAAEALEASRCSVLPIQMDVGNGEQVKAGVARVRESWGPIDILVNNAGVSGLNRIDAPEDGLWRNIIETNLTGAYLVTKEALRFMKERAGGRIINVSSVLGKFGVAGYSAYCASKHGLIGFTRALALEVASRGITVNAICPGWVDTEMARQGMEESAAYERISVEEFRKQAIQMVPMKRFIDAEEVAALVLYLASEKAGGITGQALNICGGETMV